MSQAPLQSPLLLDAGDVEAMIVRQFTARDPAYLAKQAAATAALAPMEARLAAFQQAGNDVPASDQLFIEAEWLANYTDQWPRFEAQAARLAASFADPNQDWAGAQQSDGAWGPLFTEWFEKVDASITGLNACWSADSKPPYALDFLTRVDTPDKLAAELARLQTSDILRTGLDQRDALGAVQAALSQMLLKPKFLAFLAANTTGFPFTQAMADAYWDCLRATQSSETGYWGAWFVDGEGVVKTHDLSLTFHTISYRKGAVDLWPQIVATTLATRNMTYPYGWLTDGRMNNHNNYDVATIFRYGWPAMSADQRSQAAAAIQDMVAYALSPESMPEYGAFQCSGRAFSSVGDCYYFAVTLLNAVGTWDPSLRFWTDAPPVPNAGALACAIKAKLEPLAAGSPSAADALSIVAPYCAAGGGG